MASEYAVKAICSRINISDNGHRTAVMFNEAVGDLLALPDVKKLAMNNQHLNTSRLQHSINVSFYSFRLARLLRADARAAARAGLLHDMYYYNFKDESLSCSQHSMLHPQLALQNAKRVTEISDAEADIILSHMWPLTNKAPERIEGYIVTLADKYCAVLEVLTRLLSNIAA